MRIFSALLSITVLSVSSVSFADLLVRDRRDGVTQRLSLDPERDWREEVSNPDLAAIFGPDDQLGEICFREPSAKDALTQLKRSSEYSAMSDDSYGGQVVAELLSSSIASEVITASIKFKSAFMPPSFEKTVTATIAACTPATTIIFHRNSKDGVVEKKLTDIDHLYALDNFINVNDAWNACFIGAPEKAVDLLTEMSNLSLGKSRSNKDIVEMVSYSIDGGAINAHMKYFPGPTIKNEGQKKMKVFGQVKTVIARLEACK